LQRSREPASGAAVKGESSFRVFFISWFRDKKISAQKAKKITKSTKTKGGK